MRVIKMSETWFEKVCPGFIEKIKDMSSEDYNKLYKEAIRELTEIKQQKDNKKIIVGYEKIDISIQIVMYI